MTIYRAKYASAGEAAEKIYAHELNVSTEEIHKLMYQARIERITERDDRIYYALAIMVNIGPRLSEVLDIREYDLVPRHLPLGAMVVRLRKKHRCHCPKYEAVKPKPKHKCPFLKSEPESTCLGSQEIKMLQTMLGFFRGHGPDKRLFPFAPRTFQYIFDDIRRKAGLREQIHCHSLRHFAAKFLREVPGSTPEIVMERMHHTPMIATFTYTKPSPDQIRAVLNRKLLFL